MSTLLRVLFVGISDSDIGRVTRELKKNDYSVESRLLNTLKSISTTLKKRNWDIIFIDCQTPEFGTQDAQELIKQFNLNIPLIIYSDELNEATAVEMMVAGANDYITKGDFKRLIPVVKRELREAKIRKERKRAEEQIISQSKFASESPDPILRVNRESVILYHNKASLPFLLTWKTGMGKPLPVKWRMIVKEVHYSGNNKTVEMDFQNNKFLMNIVPVKDKNYVNIYGTDITELKNTEEIYQNLVERANDGICIIQNMEIVYSNERLAQMWGGNVAELSGKQITDFVHPDSLDTVVKNYKKRMAGNIVPPIYEVFLKRKDGSKLDVELNAGIIPYNGKSADMIIIRDITERKKAEERLADSERTLRAAQALGKIGSWEANIKTGQMTWSDELYEIFERDKTLGPLTTAEIDTFYNPEDTIRLKEAIHLAIDTGKVFRADLIAHLPNGKTLYQHTAFSPFRDKNGEITKFIGVIQDITESKVAEERIRFQAELLDSAIDAVFVHNLKNRFVYANQSASQLYGYSQEEFLNSKVDLLVTKGNRENISLQKQEVLTEKQNCFETIHKRKNGATFPVEIHSRTIEWGDQTLILSVVRDISERKIAEENLKESERRLKEAQALGRIANFEVDLDTFEVYWSDEMHELFDRDRNLPPLTVTELADYFSPEEYSKYTESVRMAQEGNENNQDIVINTPSGNTRILHVLRHPIKDDNGKVFKIIGTMQDVTERKQAEEELQNSYARLSKILDGVISTMAATIEIRDPYTSGHQQRVASLAKAIAEEEGLPEETVNAIYTSGVIHDIGKIGVPADILSKPGKLNEIEFALIQVHPKIGFDVLKNIEFPFPLAQWVLQHHERIDGSGYPSELKGEEISKEARILAVADVVESMVSHRPYRPGLGIGAAMEEIEKGKGTLYDTASAEACIRLFKEKGFKFS